MTATRRVLTLLVLLLVPAGAARASDHADPMSLNVFAVQESPEANITDLHAFIVDAENRRVTTGDLLAPENRLVLSLCVRRALRPEQTSELDLEGFTFRVHMDLSPAVRFIAVSKDSPKSDDDAVNRARSMQALYGGIVTQPAQIKDSAVLEFALKLDTQSGKPQAVFARPVGISGIPGTVRILAPKGEQPMPGEIAVTTAVFDDPFIFPRFFRRNVVGIVTSIPLSALLPALPASGPAPILLWATTHQGTVQIDHVGRSLRTQLPRFGDLNDKAPATHVAAILRKHAQPTIMEAGLAAVIAPLLAHRHYDAAPDVMIYDLRKPAAFPNGRWLEDDVAVTLAEWGETLLYELSYAESRQIPRATKNDKDFLATFPYLAEPWAPEEKAPSTAPSAPDGAAIAPTTLDDSVWRRLFWMEAAGLVLLVAALFWPIRSRRWRVVLAALALVSIAWLRVVYAANVPSADPGAAAQAAQKFFRFLVGLGLVTSLFVGFVYALGRRNGRKAPPPEPAYPVGRQDPIADDATQSSFAEIHQALFDPAHSRPYYETWGGPGAPPLPIHRTTFASVTADLFSFTKDQFAMVRAARRTLVSHADLRWGPDGQGFRRLVHPMGVCLAGTWTIDAAPPHAAYTGYFAPGSEGRVIGRYSLGGNDPLGGRNRSLGLVGTIFPPEDAPDGRTPRARFITQEDLGGAHTNSIVDAVLTNSPPVTLHKRGRGLPAFLAVIVALLRSDAEPAERQLYEVAELGKAPHEPTSCPRFMRLTIVSPAPFSGERPVDFRDEILGAIYDANDRRPQRELVFAIEVADEGRRTLLQKVVIPEEAWTRIGRITFTEAAASYNGDFVVHFHHPVWRTDRNDPSTVLRSRLRR